MARDIDSVTGLPEDLGVEDDLARAEQKLVVRTERRRYGKTVTVVEGFDPGAVDVDALASRLKSKLAAGGTAADGRIELQGDHTRRLPGLLTAEGFAVDEGGE